MPPVISVLHLHTTSSFLKQTVLQKQNYLRDHSRKNQHTHSTILGLLWNVAEILLS
jgi:hypothetical protein